MPSAASALRPRVCATLRNFVRTALLIFSPTAPSSACPVPVIGSAAPISEPGIIASCSAAIAISAPALKAFLTTATVGTLLARMLSVIAIALSTRPPGVSMSNTIRARFSVCAVSSCFSTITRRFSLISPLISIITPDLAGTAGV